ncbi:MAG: MG2 domain-containing protein [Candidatus Azobacteroides sp.]|nr:MG2 domain-containing protein [Candidatus Azobacteroides sp.]
MKTRFFFLAFCLILVTAGSIFFAQNTKTQSMATTYDSLWKTVEQKEKASLPQSALEAINMIYEKALKEKNSPQLIKSLIYRMKFELSIDNDRFPELIKEIETFNENNTNVVERSMLHSILANLYSQYYQSNSFTVNRRTAVTGYIPEDIREWSGNIFIEKITAHVLLSVQQEKELQATNVSEYADILNRGESSQNLRPTLYDFLVNQAIKLFSQYISNSQTANFFPQTKIRDTRYFIPAKEFVNSPTETRDYDFIPLTLKLYQQLLAFRLKEDNPLALLIADLDRLEFIRNNTESDEAGEAYIKALNQLEKQYTGNDFCVEILYKKAFFYNQDTNTDLVPLGRGGINISEDSGKNQSEGRKRAYKICLDGIKRYPNYERINLLKNLLNQITSSYANIQAPNVVYPEKDLELTVNYKNVNKLTVEIYKINAPVTAYQNNWARNGLFEKSGVLINRKEIDLINTNPYQDNDTIIKIPMKSLGSYEYVVYSDKDEKNIANQQFSVSRLATISRMLNSGREFMVVDRISGEPVEGAKVNFYKRVKNELQFASSVVTDKSGLAKGNSDNDIVSYNVTFRNDTSLLLSPVPWSSVFRKPNESIEQLYLFTDRSIYRPGQVVYFKGIAGQLGANEQKVLANKSYKLTFRDANFKEVTTQTLKTNEFGSFAGEFVLPQNLLNGQFSISADGGGSCFFRVEEYKRPTFDIRFLPNENTYNFGDQVTVKGEAKTFSGVNLQGARVQYSVVQRPHWFFLFARSNPVQISEGFIQTKDDGSFEISFNAEKLFRDRNRQNVYYTYEIEATVTDTNGETQTSRTTISIGDRSMYLTVNGLAENVNKDDLPEVVVNALNLSNNLIQTEGTYEIYRLKGNGNLVSGKNEGDWKQDKKVASGNFSSGKTLDLNNLKNIESGKYRIILKANDNKGREVTHEQDFILASAKDKRPPVLVYEWLLTPKTTCLAGEKAEIIYGSSAKNVYVLYEIFKDGEKLSSSRFELNNENKKLEIPFLESYGNGVVVSFTFVKDNTVFNRNVEIRLKQPDRNLTLNMEVFRDRLLPGQNEEWKILVKDADKNPVLSEILAGMYDASLDKIYAHSWNFNPVYSINLWSPFLQQGIEFNNSNTSISIDSKYFETPQFSFDSFNWFGLDFGFHAVWGQTGVINRLKMKMDAVGTPMAMENAEVAAVPPVYAPSPPMAVVLKEESAGENAQPAVQIRENFNETAFFYPQLKTNEAGETLISFTVPESNTTWKFMSIAHTKDLKYGQIIKEAISQKKLMVTPNMPRFIRHGDKMTISSNISNLSDEVINGTVRIEFFDPNTNKTNIVVPDDSKNFTVESGRTTSVSWTFDVPSNIDMTACKIVAQSTNFSDGEQHLLPALPNRMLVTESLPLNVQGKQTRLFSFDKITQNSSSTLENYRLTLEFASNPTWYAVQALPAMTTPDNENVISWFAAYYANTLATYIANSTPKIKQIINTWVQQGGSKETLLSNLETNQELKAVLLEETPWVLEAQNETEQKQRLALLFDINRSNNLSVTAIDKLKSLQLQDGGWSWFKGMNSSVSITQWILYGMGQLSQLNAASYGDDVKQMQRQAIDFIDTKFKESFDNMKRFDKNWQKTTSMSTSQLEYLFVRSLYQDIPFGKAEEAAQFYSGIAEKYWAKNTGLYTRAITATLMQRTGKTTVAANILKSLREYASHKEDMGMFWANNNTSAFMFQSATAVHTFIMEAFNEAGSAPQEMDDMKLWLLKQKQTQLWESTPATVNAVYVLLKTGNNWLENEGKVNIQLGNTSIDMGNPEAGTGFFRRVFETSAITPDMSKVKITKEDEGPGWGALFRQYFEDLDKITQAKTGLNVEKKLFVEKISTAGKTLDPVSADNPLKVGDKAIVRLTVRNDRDMEFVMLKDMRGACFEPVEQISGARWRESVVYYQSTRDASMNFFFNNLPKGTYVFEYPLYVTRTGEYSNGITTIQCLYAPEFVSHTAGERVIVNP